MLTKEARPNLWDRAKNPNFLKIDLNENCKSDFLITYTVYNAIIQIPAKLPSEEPWKGTILLKKQR